VFGRYWPAANLAGPRPGKTTRRQTLIWGADCNGGIPYVILDPMARKGTTRILVVTGLRRICATPLERSWVAGLFSAAQVRTALRGLSQGNCDFPMNAWRLTPENRAERLQQAVLPLPQQLVVRADPGAGSHPERLFDGNTRGHAQRLARPSRAGAARFRQGPHQRVDDQNGYKDLPLGRGVQAVLLDLPAALYYAPVHPAQLPSETGLKFAGPPSGSYYGIAVRK